MYFWGIVRPVSSLGRASRVAGLVLGETLFLRALQLGHYIFTDQRKRMCDIIMYITLILYMASMPVRNAYMSDLRCSVRAIFFLFHLQNTPFFSKRQVYYFVVVFFVKIVRLKMITSIPFTGY